MKSEEADVVREEAYNAAGLAALCGIITEALRSNPATSEIGEAVHQLHFLAHGISNRLFALDPENL